MTLSNGQRYDRFSTRLCRYLIGVIYLECAVESDPIRKVNDLILGSLRPLRL